LHFEKLADSRGPLVMKWSVFHALTVLLVCVLVDSTRLPRLPDQLRRVGNRKRIADVHAVVADAAELGISKPAANDAPPDISTIPSSHASERLRFSVLSILLPWLYFMSTSLNIPTLPKFVNAVINKGNNDVSELSAEVYGNIAGIDAFFTFLSVNLVGCLSDYYGRRPFMFLSSLGTFPTCSLLTTAPPLLLPPTLPSLYRLGDGVSDDFLRHSAASLLSGRLRGRAHLLYALAVAGLHHGPPR
jgi:hypothetical protein